MPCAECFSNCREPVVLRSLRALISVNMEARITSEKGNWTTDSK